MEVTGRTLIPLAAPKKIADGVRGNGFLLSWDMRQFLKQATTT